MQPKLAEVSLFPDGVALERLLILRLSLLGGVIAVHNHYWGTLDVSSHQ